VVQELYRGFVQLIGTFDVLDSADEFWEFQVADVDVVVPAAEADLGFLFNFGAGLMEPPLALLALDGCFLRIELVAGAPHEPLFVVVVAAD
jgi:hypothetical protein